MLRTLFNGKTQSITSAAIIIAGATLASRALGVFRDRILAGQFGAGIELDIYYASFRIPDLVFNLLVLGAISAGFIPIFLSHLEDGFISKLTKNSDKAWRLANLVINTLFLVLVAVSLILIVFSPLIMRLIAPGFDQETLALTVKVTRIMYLSPILLGLSSILGGILQTFHRFFVYSLAPIAYNVGIIIGALFLSPIFGVMGLAYGVVLGAAAHLLIQIPTVLHLGYRWQWIFDWHDKGLRQMAKIMLPRTLSLAVNQLNLIAMTIIASLLAAGSITIFNLANNLQSFPLGLFGISFAVAAFPSLSLLATKKGHKDFIYRFSITVRQILFLIIPASILLIVLRAQVVRVVLGTGLFDWSDTVLTIQTLTFFSLSLFAQALIPLVVRAFFALHDSKTPFFSGLIGALVNIVLALQFVKVFDVAGLALAFSVGSVVNFTILWIALDSKLGQLKTYSILYATGKMLIAALYMGIVGQGIEYFIEPFTGTQTFLGLLGQSVAVVIGSAIVYFLTLRWLKSAELDLFISSFKKRFLKKSRNLDLTEAENI